MGTNTVALIQTCQMPSWLFQKGCLSLHSWQTAMLAHVGTLNSARSAFTFQSAFIWAIASVVLWNSFLGWPWANLGCCLRKHRKTLMSTKACFCRAAKFTKNKNDQWNHAGGFSISICAGLSLKMQPRNNWLNCRARCMGSEPPKCRWLHASGILRVGIWEGQSSFAQTKASTSLAWGPLKLGRLIANGSQAVPLFEPRDSFTKSYS